MSREKDFAKNTLILLIGKFATQFISFLLIPLFTHYLLTSDYGIVDLIQTYLTLLVPVLTLRLDSALFRFLIDNRENEKEKSRIISNVLIFTFFLTFLTAIIFLLISFVFTFKYIGLSIINLIVLMISSVLLQVLRGLGKNKEYSIVSIITGLLTLIINVILILIFDFNASAILISSIVANCVGIVYIIISTNILNYVNYSLLDKALIKNILNYSLPMIPNALSWWVVNVSDRTIITIFMNITYNGIYSISCKFSNILNSIYSIFNLSWQENISLHINDNDRDLYISKMFMNIFMIFASLSLLINASIPVFFDFIIGKSYIESYNYIPILLFANSWSVMISLIGGIYISLKKTKEIAITTIMSALINLIVNISLIKLIGLYAAAISTLVAYLSMALYRYYKIKKLINLKIDFKRILVFILVFMISSISYYYNNMVINYLILLAVVVYCFAVNKDIIVPFFRKIKIGKNKYL